jgi:hypothetical protein
LAEGLVRLGTWMPFEQAAEHLAFFWDVRISEATARRHTQAAGAAHVAVQTAEVERLERALPSPPAGPAVQQLSADGAMVPLLRGAWGEVKTLAIGTVAVEPAAGAVRAQDLSYFSRLADHATFARLGLVETHRRGTATAGTVVGVMDGAEWEQSFLDYHRPDAVRVLDFPHALEHLSAAAQATFGPGTAATAAWLEAQADALKHGAPSAVLVALQALPTPRAAHPATADQVRDGTFRYLEKRLDQLRYAEYLAAGYPIGSGAVESANKLVVEARLKGSGMHWAPAHVNPLLALRTIACADRWAEAWPAICGQLRRQAWAARAARRRARRLPPLPPVTPAALPRPKLPRPASPPVRPPLVVNRRPTAAHPWKRRPFLLGVRHHANPGAKL